MINMYTNIVRRRSFHIFPNEQEPITQSNLDYIVAFFDQCKPLIPGIKTELRIVPAGSISFKTRQQYNLLFYSEKKDGYLENIGYLVQQLDLFLVSMNIGTLWFGLARCDMKQYHGLDYCILLAISKVAPSRFRNSISDFIRKPIDSFWNGTRISGVTDYVQTAPSAINSQPWLVDHQNDTLTIKRIKNPVISYFNKIDIGIFLYYMELCLEQNEIAYKVQYFVNDTIAAIYKI